MPLTPTDFPGSPPADRIAELDRLSHAAFDSAQATAASIGSPHPAFQAVGYMLASALNRFQDSVADAEAADLGIAVGAAVGMVVGQLAPGDRETFMAAFAAQAMETETETLALSRPAH